MSGGGARDPVALLGAEKQAATALALAYPDQAFVFVSSEPVLDGWDLRNVRFMRADPQAAARELEPFGPRVVPLCARWAQAACEAGGLRNRLGDFALRQTFATLEQSLEKRTLPVRSRIPSDSAESWQVKGDVWHRPDFTISGTRLELEALEDEACGTVFQRAVTATERFIATGVRHSGSGADIGVLRVLGETHAREEVLTAAETVHEATVVEATLQALDRLEHVGVFQATWLRCAEGLRLSSLRPVLGPVAQTLRRAGLDPLRPLNRSAPESDGVHIAAAGHRMIADIHYSSYGTPA